MRANTKEIKSKKITKEQHLCECCEKETVDPSFPHYIAEDATGTHSTAEAELCSECYETAEENGAQDLFELLEILKETKEIL